MHRLYHILLFLLPMISVGQNLVPNGSFNVGFSCEPNTLMSPNFSPWTQLYSTPDEYHECYPPSFSVPQNSWGFQNPLDGEGYYGLAVFYIETLKREFISVELTEPLVENVLYRGTFNVSRMDSCWYAIKSMGMLFTETPPLADLNHLFSQSPQVLPENNSFLSDRTDWVQVSASFIAEGGERYLTIGNFYDDVLTDTLLVEGGAIRPNDANYWRLSYYYVDDVSVIPDSIIQSVNENDFSFSIYPNPATTNLTIESRTPLAQVWVRDVAGRALRYTTLSRGTQDDRAVVDVSSLPSGIYLVEVLTQNDQRLVQKVVVE